MSPSVSGSRRRILIAAAALVAGGYVSYKLSKSSVFSRRKEQLLQTFKSISYLGEAVSHSVESVSLISSDLKTFLYSDEDEVPQSLKQAFKIGQCSELQETLLVLCSTLTQGVLQGFNGNGGRHRYGYFTDDFQGMYTTKSKYEDPCQSMGQDPVAAKAWNEGTCKEVRSVQFLADNCDDHLAEKFKKRTTFNGEEILRQRANCEMKSQSDIHREASHCGGPWPDMDKDLEWNEWQTKTQLCGEEFSVFVDPSCPINSNRRTQRFSTAFHKGRGRQRNHQNGAGLPERLLDKLFSDAGMGFASAVVGSVARNTVLSLLDGFQEWKQEANKGGLKCRDGIQALGDKEFQNSLSEESSKEGGLPSKISAERQATGSMDRGILSRKAMGQMQIVDFLCSNKGKSLIGEYIQTFVRTAVSVYIDKTKDVNFYEDMVASVTNPAHQVATKELLTSVCNGAVDTFVRTSHNMLFVKDSGQSESVSAHQPNSYRVEKLNKTVEEPHSFLDQSKDVMQFKHRNCLPMISLGTPALEDFVTDNDLEVTDNDLEVPKLAASRFSASGSSDSQCKTDQHMVSLQRDGAAEDGERLIVRSGDVKSVPTWIDGLSKALAVPSNRRLIIEVAGTMASEVVRSIFEGMGSTFSRFFRFKRYGMLEARSSNHEAQVKGHLEGRSGSTMKAAGAKFFLLATICLAFILHILIHFRVLQAA